MIVGSADAGDDERRRHDHDPHRRTERWTPRSTRPATRSTSSTPPTIARTRRCTARRCRRTACSRPPPATGTPARPSRRTNDDAVLVIIPLGGTGTEFAAAVPFSDDGQRPLLGGHVRRQQQDRRRRLRRGAATTSSSRSPASTPTGPATPRSARHRHGQDQRQSSAATPGRGARRGRPVRRQDRHRRNRRALVSAGDVSTPADAAAALVTGACGAAVRRRYRTRPPPTSRRQSRLTPMSARTRRRTARRTDGARRPPMRRPPTSSRSRPAPTRARTSPRRR